MYLIRNKHKLKLKNEVKKGVKCLWWCGCFVAIVKETEKWKQKISKKQRKIFGSDLFLRRKKGKNRESRVGRDEGRIQDVER